MTALTDNLAQPTSDPAILELPGPIRRFADSRLQQSITAALAGIEPGKTGAVVAFADRDAAGLATVAKLGDRWSVVMVGRKPYGGKLEVEAAVRWSWVVLLAMSNLISV